LPGISIADGLFRVNQNKRLYLRLLRSFARDFAGASGELAGYLERGRHDEARRLAHSIKGVAGNIGAVELSVCAAAAEDLLVAGMQEQSSTTWIDFIQALEKVMDGLRQNLPESTATTKTTDRVSDDSMGSALTVPMLLDMAELLNEDLSAALIRIEESASALRALAGDAAWAGFRDHLEGFEIDEAIDFLRGLAISLQSGRNDDDQRE
jgi:HPt (histidine-containing phosphotransfer) domain-containing protein